eukprot:XP_011662521.1 PREDICTED: uncharacterized protein LOC100889964 isoform X3 [Strongylocentrotus purpuratus]
MLTEQTAAEIREMLQDMPPSHLEQQSEMAAAAYREQMEYEAELTPITEEGSMSSRSTNTRGSSYRGQDSLERNKRNGTISKQYQDPMGKFAGESSLEEQYKEEEINGEDSKTKIKTYSAKRVSSKVYTGGEMVPIPELDSGEITMSSLGDIKIINRRNISSLQSSPSGEITVSESGDVTVITSKRRSLNQASSPTGEITLSGSGNVRFSLQRSPLAASSTNSTGEITLTNEGDVKFSLSKRKAQGSSPSSPTGEIKLTGSGDVTFSLNNDSRSSSTPSTPIGI